MSLKEIATYGVTKKRDVVDELDSKIEEIDRLGFTVLQTSMSDSQLNLGVETSLKLFSPVS